MKVVNQLPESTLAKIDGMDKCIEKLMIEHRMLNKNDDPQRAQVLEPLLAYLACALTSRGTATLTHFYADHWAKDHDRHVNAWNKALRQATIYLWDNEPIRQTVFDRWSILYGREDRQRRQLGSTITDHPHGITVVGALYKIQGAIFDLVDNKKLESDTLDYLRICRHPDARKIPLMI